MKELRGTATTLVAATPDECFVVLEDVEHYPSWYPDVVRSVEVVERGASEEATKIRAKLHVEHGPITKDFDLLMTVKRHQPERVELSRGTNGRSDQRFDVTWRVKEGERSSLALDLAANLDAPRFLPLGGIGESVAKGFVAAAKQAIESHR